LGPLGGGAGTVKIGPGSPFVVTWQVITGVAIICTQCFIRKPEGSAAMLPAMRMLSNDHERERVMS